MWATATKAALIIELTVPWEERIPSAHEFKRIKYSDLAAERRDGGTDRDHPSRRSWMQGLRGKFRNPASPSSWENWDKPEENHQGAGGGGKLVVVAMEEGKELGLCTQWGKLQGVAGRRPHKPLPPHRETYWECSFGSVVRALH